MWKFVVLLILLKFSSTFAQELNYQPLPNTTIPISYNLIIETKVHSASRTFTGTIVITAKVLEVTDEIILNSQGLKIENVVVIGAVVSGRDFPEQDILRIQLTEEMIVDKDYTILIQFSGMMQLVSDGFFRSSYIIRENNVDKYVWQAATNFLPSSARQAFPCYDNPQYRATFKLSVTHDRSYRSIFTTPEELTTLLPENKVQTEFKETPRISPSSMAFFVSGFARKTEVLSDGIQHEVLVRGTEIEHVDMLLEVTHSVYAALKDLFDFPLPISKLFSVAIPDFGKTNVANYAINNYREDLVLFDPLISEETKVLEISKLVTNNLISQYFGNVITLDTFDNIWLFRGLAKFMEYQLIKKHQMFTTEVLQATLSAASYSDDESFSDIMAMKTACVFRMVFEVMGEDAFIGALKTLLKDFEFSTISSDDFYEYLQVSYQASPTYNSKIMLNSLIEGWTKQKQPTTLIVIRYLDNGLYKVRVGFENRVHEWIPYNFISSNVDAVSTEMQWLSPKDQEILFEIPELKSEDYLLFNVNQFGFYRVNYDINNWNLIIEVLNENHNEFNDVTRAQLLDDAMNLAVEGNVDYELVFNMINYLKNETNSLPWATATKNLMILNDLLANTEAQAYFRVLMQEISDNYIEFIGFSDVANEMFEDKLSRSNAINFACSMGSQKCLNTSLQMLEAHIDGSETIAVNLQSTIFCNGLRGAVADGNNDTSLLEALWQSMQQSDNTEYRLKIIDILGCYNNAKHLKDLLETTVATVSNEVRYLIPERFRILQSVYSQSSIGVEVAIDFMIEYSSTVLRLFQTNDLAQTFITSLSNKIAERKVFDKYIELIEIIFTSLNPDATRTAISKVLSNLRWQERNTKKILNWLHKYFNVPVDETTIAPVTSDNPLTTQISTESSTVETTTPAGALGLFVCFKLFILCTLFSLSFV